MAEETEMAEERVAKVQIESRRSMRGTKAATSDTVDEYLSKWTGTLESRVKFVVH